MLVVMEKEDGTPVDVILTSGFDDNTEALFKYMVKAIARGATVVKMSKEATLISMTVD